LQLAILANHGHLQAVWMAGKIEGVAALDAEEVAVQSALIAIVAANNFHAGAGSANTQRGGATVAAVGADCAYVVHLPRASLVAISARGEGTHRADVNA